MYNQRYLLSCVRVVVLPLSIGFNAVCFYVFDRYIIQSLREMVYSTQAIRNMLLILPRAQVFTFAGNRTGTHFAIVPIFFVVGNASTPKSSCRHNEIMVVNPKTTGSQTLKHTIGRYKCAYMMFASDHHLHVFLLHPGQLARPCSWPNCTRDRCSWSLPSKAARCRSVGVTRFVEPQALP
jgi:hypothetical protein